VSSASGSPITLSTTSLASAIESISSVLRIGKLVSDTFYAARSFIDHLTVANVTVGSSSTPSGVTLYDSVTKQPYCFNIANGAPTTTPGICAESTETTNPFATSTAEGALLQATSSTSISGTTSGAFTITLNGATPTYVPVGGIYLETGAVVAGGSGSTTPYQVYVNGNISDTISPALDTSTPTTYILTYHAADSAGNTATAYRSVIIEDIVSTVSTDTATTTTTVSTDTAATATTTTAIDTTIATTTDATASTTTVTGDTTATTTTGN
jgi:chitinase